jgi:branched-chain amino acid transport system substrate-binding protein
MRKLFPYVSVLFLITIIGCAAQSPKVVDKRIDTVKIKNGDPVHIAYWLVISGSNKALGMDCVRGIEIAIDDFGGKIKGHRIKLSAHDSRCNNAGGRKAAKEIASDPTIVAAIGSNCSSAAKPGVPILWGAGIPTISPSNTMPYFTEPNRGDGYNGYLRTSWNDKVQGAVAAEFVKNVLELNSAATIHDGSIYAVALADEFAATFKKLGGTITAQEAVKPGDTSMRSLLTSVATGKPGIIYYPIFIAEGGLITRQAKEISGIENTKLMGADGIFTPDFYKVAGEAAVGMYHTRWDFYSFPAAYKIFLKKHREKYGKKPDAKLLHAFAYDATMLILKAIEKVAVLDSNGSLTIDRMKLRHALYATKDFKGMTGTLNCNRYGDCAATRIVVYETKIENIKKGKMPTKPFWKKR